MSMHPTRNLFKDFKEGSEVFVETGCYRGDGIQLALDAGFKNIISIDNDMENITFCMDRFDLIRNPKPNIHLLYGDSATMLGKAIQGIKEPITFWLDSHWQMLEGTQPGENPFPLLKELEQIREHVKVNGIFHTILIDDMLIMQPDIVGYSNKDIKKALWAIDPKYDFKLFANPVINNILVAHHIDW